MVRGSGRPSCGGSLKRNLGAIAITYLFGNEDELTQYHNSSVGMSIYMHIS